MWLLGVLPAVVVSLQATAIFPVLWQTVPLAGFAPHEGAAYVAPLDTSRFPQSDNPPDILMENGVPSAFPPTLGWGIVATDGLGRYHVSQGAIYLSATDNSDPRSNGRTYQVRRPWPVSRLLFIGAWLVALAVSWVMAGRVRAPLFAFLLRPPFWSVVALMFAAVAANRLWLFLDYPLVAIHPDSGSYYSVAEMLGTGTLPNFGNRPPVYPIFLRLVFAIVDTALFMSFSQMLLAFVAAVLVVYAVRTWRTWLSFPAAAAMTLFMYSVTVMEHDSAMLSESLYTTWLIFGFGALIAGLRGFRWGWLAWASTAFALAILTRPAGFFLVVSYLLVLGWMLYQRATRRAVVAFMLPLPVLLISMSAYNLRVVKAFAPTTWGEANLAVATFLYWEQDPAYPPEINAGIARIRDIIAERYVVTNLDRNLLDQTWDPERLAPIFVQSFNGAALDVAMRMGGNYETAGREWIRRIAFDSIAKNPGYYAKFFVSMMYLYFKPPSEFDFRAYLLNRAQVVFIDRLFSPSRGDAFMVRLGKEFANPSPGRVIITQPDPAVSMALQDRILLPATPWWRVYHLTYVVRRALAPHWIWPLVWLTGLLASAALLVKTRARHHGAFAVFIVTISTLGASLVVSMVEYSQPRYSYPMEWTYLLTAVMLPLLFWRDEPARSPSR